MWLLKNLNHMCGPNLWFTLFLMNSADLQENRDCISQLGISGDFLKGTHEVLTIKERYVGKY